MLRQRLCQPFRDALRRVAAAVVLALYVVVTLAGGALVVCQEQDGHTAIEWRGTECCGTETASVPTSEHVSARAPDADADGCTECVDLPAASLLTSTAAPVLRVASEPAPAPDTASCAPLWTVTIRAAVAPAAFATASAPPLPGRPPQLVHLRTVVIRC